jgi:hypothetical protein
MTQLLLITLAPTLTAALVSSQASKSNKEPIITIISSSFLCANTNLSQSFLHVATVNITCILANLLGLYLFADLIFLRAGGGSMACSLFEMVSLTINALMEEYATTSLAHTQ